MSPTTAPFQPKHDNLGGILWMLGAVLALTGMFVIVKEMVRELPVFVVAIMRSATALVLMVPWMMRVGLDGMSTKRPGGHLARAFFGITSFVCVVYALSKLLMADAMVLSFTSPLWAILVSALLLGEIAGARRIAATLCGFVGVLLIVKPHGGVDPAMLVALGGALLTAFAMISLKSLSATEPPTRIVFYFFTFGTIMLLPAAIATWQTPSWVQLAWLFGAGLLGTIGQDWLARAYEAAEVTVVAPFDFLRPPAAALLAFALFGEVPDQWSILGMAIVIGASIYIARSAAR